MQRDTDLPLLFVPAEGSSPGSQEVSLRAASRAVFNGDIDTDTKELGNEILR
jgi:hypothetical protein